ncbi:MAG: phosphoglycerate mutase, partial [Planctomycetes bacterium]|nr:phosphoglycerate mutase [Planctomycetota bacterium]
EKQDAFRMLVSPDHPTLLQTKTHSHGDVPFAIAGTGIKADSYMHYNDHSAATSPVAFPQGHELMPYFLAQKNIP